MHIYFIIYTYQSNVYDVCMFVCHCVVCHCVEFMYVCMSLCRVYQTFSRWLEEPLLHESTVHLPSLPPQYDASRLSQLFQSDNV